MRKQLNFLCTGNKIFAKYQAQIPTPHCVRPCPKLSMLGNAYTELFAYEAY